VRDSYQFDLDGIYHNDPSDDEARIADAYSDVWDAISKIVDDKDRPLIPDHWRMKTEIPMGYIQIPDWATVGEMPKCSPEHVEIAARFMKSAMGHVKRKGHMKTSRGEEIYLNKLRSIRALDIVTPHFGFYCPDWDAPHINENMGLFWLEEISSETRNDEFVSAVRAHRFLPEATDITIARRINALWILNTRKDFTRKVIGERYIHQLLDAKSGGRGGYPSIGRAKQMPSWDDLERAFIIAVLDGHITTSWDGAKASTMTEVIALKRRYKLHLSADEITYEDASKLDETTRRRIARERVSARKSNFRNHQEPNRPSGDHTPDAERSKEDEDHRRLHDRTVPVPR